MAKLNLLKRIVDIISKRPLQTLQVSSYLNMFSKLVFGFINNKNTPWYRNPDFRNMVLTLVTSLLSIGIPKAVGALKGLGNGEDLGQDAIAKLLHNLREDEFVYEFSPSELLGLFDKLRNSVFFIGSAVEVANLVALLILLKDICRMLIIMYRKRDVISDYLEGQQELREIEEYNSNFRNKLSPFKGVKFHKDESYDFRLARFIRANQHKNVSRRDLVRAFDMLEGGNDGY
jgi:hypothetical protein